MASMMASESSRIVLSASATEPWGSSKAAWHPVNPSNATRAARQAIRRLVNEREAGEHPGRGGNPKRMTCIAMTPSDLSRSCRRDPQLAIPGASRERYHHENVRTWPGDGSIALDGLGACAPSLVRWRDRSRSLVEGARICRPCADAEAAPQ